MINFVISKDEITKEYEYSPGENIYKMKVDIIKDFELSCEYIDLNITIERAIRVMGKFNMEPGILPRTMDMYTFDRYGIDGKTITATFNEVIDYKPFDRKVRVSSSNLGSTEKYKLGVAKVDRVLFNLDSENDFPPLGS